MSISRVLPVVALIVASACSAHKTTVQTDQGPATVTTSNDNKTTTIESKEGKVTVGSDIDTSKLGAPLYPGAEKSEGGYSVQSAQGSGSMGSFKTSDDFDKVYAFYKSKMPQGSEKVKMSNGGESMATFDVQDAKAGETSVMIDSKGAGETAILITHKDAQ